MSKGSRFEGGCHCGLVRFAVVGEIDELTICNCSICRKTGYLHWEVDAGQFDLLSDEDAIEHYQFGTMTSKNYFCRSCGISSFRRSRTSPDQIDINARCLDGVDGVELAKEIPLFHFDGQNWEAAAKND